MARANLNITAQLRETFLSSQEESSNVRSIIVKIVKEDLVQSSLLERKGNAEKDFDNDMRNNLNENDACLVIFCLDTSGKGRKWLLFSWIPDGCKVRDKMLYSSSREDLKKGLGLGFFSFDYGGNLLSDIKWSHFQAYCNRDLNDPDLLTATERLIIEENALVNNEIVSNKSSTMSVIPFKLGGGVAEAFNKIKTGDVNWIEMSVVSEVIQLESTNTVDSKASLQHHINIENAR